MMGVRLDGWGSVKTSELRRGDENRPQRWILASSRVNGTAVPGSLSEGAAERSEAEGVSFVGCFGPLVYTQALIGSEIFERLRSSGDTPSVSPCGLPAPSGREPGTVVGGAFHSTGYSLKSGVTGDFHRPYEGSGNFTFCHSTGYSRNRRGAGDFHRPYGGRVPFIVPLGKREGAGDFHRPKGVCRSLGGAV